MWIDSERVELGRIADNKQAQYSESGLPAPSLARFRVIILAHRFPQSTVEIPRVFDITFSTVKQLPYLMQNIK